MKKNTQHHETNNNYGKERRVGEGPDLIKYNKMETILKNRGNLNHSKMNIYRLPANSDGERDMNLVNMILNIDSNNSNNFKKPRDVYSIYADMKVLGFNEEFKNSIQNSEKIIRIPNNTNMYISDLKVNDPNSFLVLPLLGKGHLWSTLIRRTDEGINALVINKGLRYWHDPVEEFVFKNENQNNLMDVLKYSNAMYSPNIEDVYRKFISQSDKQYNLQVNTSPQKVGNCFTKNIQAGIKVAYASRNMGPEQMRAFRINREYTPLGTRDVKRKTFKWEIMSTEKMQKFFAWKIAIKNPSIKHNVEKSLYIYSSNKNFRNEIKFGNDPVYTFLKSFEKNKSSNNLSMDETLKDLIKNVTPFTYTQNRESIDHIVNKVNDPEYKEIYGSLDSANKLAGVAMSNIYFDFFMEARHDVAKSLEACFDKKGVYKDLPQKERTKILLEKIEPEMLYVHESKVKEAISDVYGNENVSKEYNRIYEMAKQSQREREKNKPSYEDMRQISQHFPMILEQIRDRLSEYNYHIGEGMLKKGNPIQALRFIDKSLLIKETFDNRYTKGVCLEKLKNSNEAVKEFSLAIKNNPESPLAYVARGMAYGKLNNMLAANEDFNKAVELKPELKPQIKNELQKQKKDFSKFMSI